MAMENGECEVFEDCYGYTRCGCCREAIFCDENGDMPEECPVCRVRLSYSIYDLEVTQP